MNSKYTLNSGNLMLKRYTDLPSLLNILETETITLLSPVLWDDKNDAYYMQLYKDKKKLASVLALCFTNASETYHHWKVFSPGPSGVCIVFDMEKLLESMSKTVDFEARNVRYRTLNSAREKDLKTNELPFIKRAGYGPEKEFRVVYSSKAEEHSSLQVPIELSCIKSISLSPWLHESLRDTTTNSIHRASKKVKPKVSRSTLTSNQEWRELGHEAT